MTKGRAGSGGTPLGGMPGSPVSRPVGPVNRSARSTLEVEGRTPCIIAMATRSRRGVARLMFGSVTDQVLRESHVPVLPVTVALSVGPDEYQIATKEARIVATAG